jgi:hypothetical protein
VLNCCWNKKTWFTVRSLPTKLQQNASIKS